MLPMFVVAQKQDVYVKLTDAKGTPINGDVVTRGFEKSLYALTFATAGKNNSQVNFTMNITGASAELKKAMANGEFLMTGQVTVTQNGSNGLPVTIYEIKMEKIKIQSCNESMGCNSVMTTSVTIQPVRIGWTYYQTTAKTGTQTISNKYGFDADTGGAWTKF
jgi:type VI protein secretion system component Hcp